MKLARSWIVVFSCLTLLLSGCVNIFGGKHKTSGGFHYKSKIDTTTLLRDEKKSGV